MVSNQQQKKIPSCYCVRLTSCRRAPSHSLRQNLNNGLTAMGAQVRDANYNALVAMNPLLQNAFPAVAAATAAHAAGRRSRP
mmetsp:Transcript_10151/g.20389  ORF Transcript_10151/g.20389 Transcript_10151/m.20389 type:complete len:82 (+) Transcript_10151:174-419(+)